jgi:hypothetical protein
VSKSLKYPNITLGQVCYEAFVKASKTSYSDNPDWDDLDDEVCDAWEAAAAAVAAFSEG